MPDSSNHKRPAEDDPFARALQETSSTNKRPRTDQPSDTDTSVHYRWLDLGQVDGRRRVHSGIVISSDNERYTVKTGSVVKLWTESSDDDPTWLCVVEELWQPATAAEANVETIRFRGRWLYTADDLANYYGRWTGIMSKSQLMEKLLPGEVVLSDQRDVNRMASIHSLVQVRFMEPHESVPARDVILCRYQLETSNKSAWKLSAYKPLGGTTSSQSSEPDDDDSVSSSSSNKMRVMAEGEGSALRESISVGGKHQVLVGPFVPGAHQVRSRNPVLVWSPGRISDDDLHQFMQDLAALHTPYLKKHGLVSDEPYTPLPAAEAEALIRETGERLTGSLVSTASRLGGQKNGLLKECDADAVLKLLHDHNYNTQAALEAVRSDLDRLTQAWTRSEKKIFDDTFRHSQGSLRRIARAAAPTKSHKDVVDYWFRFKIADQFRLFQNKKREQALRMVECIEKRRYHECTLNTFSPSHGSGEAKESRPKKHWSETSVGEVTGAVEDRRLTAKALLLDVQDTMGKDVMGEVAGIVRDLYRSYSIQSKKELFGLLRGQPELQKRFLDFLPKNV